MMRMLLVAALAAATPALAQRGPRGVLNEPAPGWAVKQWLHLPAGESTLDVGDFRGKVLYLYCFQSWCPGCHSHGFPTLNKMIERYQGNRDVEFVAVQTVFEGYQTNTIEHARRVARRYGLRIPIGHSGERGKPSELMQSYRTGGTPWTIIIDRQGIVRFNDFHVDVERAATLIDHLLAESGPPTRTPALPRSRGGLDMLGKRLPLDGLRWLNTPERKPPPVEGKVTLIRWWTDTCPYCTRSLPAIEQLREQFGRRGLQTIAVYHAKPPRPVDDEAVLGAARARNYNGPVSVDPDWRSLRRLYLAEHRRSATSVSFLLDREGVVRFVHPGPEFGPTDDAAKRLVNQDYEDLKAAIAALLGE